MESEDGQAETSKAKVEERVVGGGCQRAPLGEEEEEPGEAGRGRRDGVGGKVIACWVIYLVILADRPRALGWDDGGRE
ncbi:hypothetical protein M0802_010301 [Mischocyttarus mexicanus]|nr:hypothetical protein M0802_010301 [Mischocyttarus mexicanus]